MENDVKLLRLITKAEEFLRKNNLDDLRIDRKDEHTDCVCNDDKIYVSDALIKFHLQMLTTEFVTKTDN